MVEVASAVQAPILDVAATEPIACVMAVAVVLGTTLGPTSAEGVVVVAIHTGAIMSLVVLCHIRDSPSPSSCIRNTVVQ